jgi:hypothetical protein
MGGKVLKRVKRFLLFIDIKVIRKKSTTPAGEKILDIPENQYSRPPLLEKVGKVFIIWFS